MKDTGITKFFVLSLIFFFIILFFLYLTRGILIPFVISALLAYLLAPLVKKIMLFGVKRWVAVLFVVLLVCMVSAFAISVVVPVVTEEVNVLIKNFPEYKQSIISFVEKQKNYTDKIVPFLNKYNIADTLTEKSTAFITTEVSKIPVYITGIISTISIICLVPIITFFMLLGYDDFSRSVIQLIPSRYVEFCISLKHEIDFVLGGYIRGQIIEVFFISLCAVIALSVIGIKYSLLIGIVAGLCNLIPYLGPAIGFVLGVIVAAFQFHAIIPVIEVAAVFLIIQQLDNNIVQPIVVGQNVNLGPVAMMFALLAGANVFGIIGMFLAVPVLALMKNICVMLINRYKQIY